MYTLFSQTLSNKAED